MGYEHCIGRLAAAAGRQLSDAEVRAIFERIHQAALDIKAGRASVADVSAGTKVSAVAGADDLFKQAALRAAQELEHEARVAEKQANLQVLKLRARISDVDAAIQSGVSPLDAVEKTIARDYSGRVNLASLEQRVAGHKAYFGSKLLPTWDALGDDFLGFVQDRTKLVQLLKEMRGEQTGDAAARKGGKAWIETAEEMRQVFNAAGGDIGRLDDWGFPQHHGQVKVASAGRDTWVNDMLPLMKKTQAKGSYYVDELGVPWPETQLRQFLEKAWENIATDGHANAEAGRAVVSGKRANRHAEHRQIHFAEADDVVWYWERYGERSALEILTSHIDTMARDIAFIEHFGPNPNVAYQTLRDMALRQATEAEPTKTKSLEGRAVKLDELYDYAAGRTKPSANLTVQKVADGIAHLNVAGKLGGASLASLFGDKAMVEAVSHLNHMPLLERWRVGLSMMNPANVADRRLLQQQGLMLESVRSGLARFYEGLGQTSTTGKLANAVMRVTGMQAINDVRKGSFGLNLFAAIGNEIAAGKSFGQLGDSDVRTLRNYGITEADWKVWQLAKRDTISGVTDVLTPEAISRISDADLAKAGLDAKAKREAIVKLLGAVNTESEFAVVTPGWKERAQFYGDLQRGTVKGEIARSVLQFKSFPWAMLKRGMDAVANADTPASKATMTAYLIASTTLAGAMLIQVRETLAGKDPRAMVDKDWYKFWGQAFLQGGALGIYGDFLYGINETRYGSGPIETLAGPTLGPLLELGLVQPLTAAKRAAEGKETRLGAQTLQDLKGFVPGGNIWYAKAALDHLIWQQVAEALSPGYLSSIRSKTMKETGQDWWWAPGELTPARAPALGAAIDR